MADGSQIRGGSWADDAPDGREWIPAELTDAPASVYARRRRDQEAPTQDEGGGPDAGAAPFDRSRSRLRDGLGELSGADEESSLERRIREAKDRAAELEKRIRETEERVSQALGAIDQDTRRDEPTHP